jgi:general secretion pathway protein L
MTTLRILVDAPPEPARESEWALFDASHRVVRTGRSARTSWPAADDVEAVIGAARGRLVTISLPPVPAQRLAAAARYALEDQLAGAADDSHIAPATQSADGSLRVAIVEDAWMRSFAVASLKSGIQWRKVMLESDLAQPPAGGWCWCAAAADQPGFARTAAGATIAVGPVRGNTLPDEITVALAGSRAQRPRVVRVDMTGATPALMAQAREATGVEFSAGATWRWHAASAATFSAAIDLQSGAFGARPAAPRVDVARWLRPALLVAACAAGVHILASVGQWLSLHWQSSELLRDLAAVARTAAPDAPVDLAPATAIARRDASLRHSAGLAAADDLVPLLARAAPVLSGLPPGAMRSLRYADGHVVIDLQKLDAAQLSRVQQDLQREGLVAIGAPTASGARLRLGLD